MPSPLVALRALPHFLWPSTRQVRLRVRFTGGFRDITMGAQVERAENQGLVLLQQHYYTREL
jgi:hypothetical protein